MKLIDADALDGKLDALMKRYAAQGRKQVAEDYNFVRTVLMTAPTIPTIEARPVVRGEWVHDSIGFSDFWTCSACHEAWFFDYDPVRESTRVNFCPNCGADMRGD